MAKKRWTKKVSGIKNTNLKTNKYNSGIGYPRKIMQSRHKDLTDN